MITIALNFRSLSPLVMHSSRLGDPLAPVAIALRRYHEMEQLAPDDLLAIGDLEFIGGLWTRNGSPCVPGRTLTAALHEAARRRSCDAKAARALMVEADCPLEYPGPQDVAALMKNPSFRLRSSVVQDGKRRILTRPIFRSWALTAVIQYDPDLINRDVVIDCAIAAGDTIGIGAGRPQQGRFSVTPALAASA